MTKTISLLIFFFLGITLSYTHNYHVGITDIAYNKETKSLEITMKLFSDDLKRAIESKSVEKINLGEENELEKADELIFSYLKQNFSVKVNETPSSFVFVGKEVEHHDTWCYLEIKNIPFVTTAEISNTVFFEMFDDQTNRINFKYGAAEQSLTLTQNNNSGSVSFKND